MDLIIEKQVVKLSLCLDLRQLNVDDVALALICDGFDRRGLAHARRTMKHESESIRNPLCIIPITTSQKEVHTLLHMIALLEEHILERPVRCELGLGVDQVRSRQRILCTLGFGLNHLVKEVAVSAQLIHHAPLILCITRLDKRLEVLDIMIVTVELELHQLKQTIVDLELLQLEQHVCLKRN